MLICDYIFLDNMTLCRGDIMNVIATRTNVTAPFRQIIKLSVH